MAQDEVALDLKVNGVEPAIKSVKDLRDAIKQARDEQVKMSEQFGNDSKQYKEASKNLASLTDKVDDLNDSTSSLKGNSVEQLTQGFGQLKEGVMNLDIDKIKVGLNSMKSGIMQFGQSAMTSLSGVQKAMIATGIGAFLVALGLIVAYWDDLKGLVSGVSSEQEKLNKASQENLDTEKAKQEALGSQDNILKQQGKSEKEILQMKIKQTDETIKASEVQIENTKVTNEAQLKASERNKEILEGLLKFVSLPITALLKGIDAIGGAFGKNFGLEEKFFGGISKMVFDPEEVKANGDKTLEEQQKALTKLKNDRAGFQNGIKKIDDDALAKQRENAKAIADENLKALKDLEDAKIANETNEEKRAIDKAVLDKKRRDEAINSSRVSEDIKTAQLIESQTTLQNELTAIDAKAEAERKANEEKVKAEQKIKDDKEIADAIAKQKAITEQTNTENLARAELNVLNNKNSIDAQILLLTTKRDIELQNTELTESQVALIKAKYTEQTEELERQERAKTVQQNLELTKTSLEGAQALSDTFFAFKMAKVKKGSAEEEALAKKQFEINKAMQLGMAVINGVQSVLAITSVPDFTMGVATAIRIGAQVALTAASIAKIATTKFGSTGGGGSVVGGGGGSAPSMNVPNAPTISNPNANVNGSQFDEQGNKINNNNQIITVNATIGVDEVSNKQHRVAVLEGQAKF